MSSRSHSRRKVNPVDEHRHRGSSSDRRLVQARKKAELYLKRYDRLTEEFDRHESRSCSPENDYYREFFKLLRVITLF